MAWTNAIVNGTTPDLEERARTGLRMMIESLAARYASAVVVDQASEQAVLGEAQRRFAAQLGNYPVPTIALSAINFVALLASGSRTTTTASADQVNGGAGQNARGVIVILNNTVPGTGSITPAIQRKNSDGTYTNLVTGAASVAAGKAILLLDPLLGTQTPAADFDAVLDGILPQTWRVNVVANNANAVTYSVDAYLIR